MKHERIQLPCTAPDVNQTASPKPITTPASKHAGLIQDRGGEKEEEEEEERKGKERRRERRRRGTGEEKKKRKEGEGGAHSCSWLPPAGCVHSLDRYRLTHPRPPTPEAHSCATLLGAVLPSDQGRQLALPLRRVVARSPRFLERTRSAEGDISGKKFCFRFKVSEEERIATRTRTWGASMYSRLLLQLRRPSALRGARQLCGLLSVQRPLLSTSFAGAVTRCSCGCVGARLTGAATRCGCGCGCGCVVCPPPPPKQPPPKTTTKNHHSTKTTTKNDQNRWANPGSNWRPSDLQSDALPTELLAR